MASSSSSSWPIARQISECFIKPKPAQDIVHLTPWDLFVISHRYTQRGFLFKPSSLHPIQTLLDKLKESLHASLVHFYSLAGQLETRLDEADQTCIIFIDCNKGPGARFVHATLDVRVAEVASLNARQIESIDSLFDHNDAVNHDGHVRPLLTVQVTELIDGVFIAYSLNHVCADGESFWHFLNSWSEIFTDAKISRPPVYERWFIDGNGPVKLPHDFPQNRRSESCGFRIRVFHFSSESIANLKSKANSESNGSINQISPFQALAALVWRGITRARCVSDEANTDCALTFNNRGRLNPPLSPNYFGNCVQIGVASTVAGELMQRSLGWAATKVNEVVASHDDEKVRARIEKWMKNPGGGVYRAGGRNNCSVVFGGSTRFDCRGVDFGMGKVVAVICGSGSKREGKVTCGAGLEEDGSVDLEVGLSADSMGVLELDREFLEFVSFYR